MKKITMLIAFFAFISWQGNAQVSDYSFVASSGTFDTLVSGTNVPAIEADYAISGLLPIGFSFTFDGVSYDSLKASSDGFVSFNPAATNTGTNDLDNTTSSRRPLIAPLWDDNDGSATGGVSYASYLTTGTAPNRVFTFEWKNWEWRWSSSTPTISFQVKLYETSNVVELVYRQESGTVSSGTASIGLTGVGTFLSLDGSGTNPSVSSITETSGISAKPATGQVYSFTPASCPEPGTLAASNVTATAADLSWVESGSATLWELEWDTAGFTVGSGNNVASGTATSPYALTTLTANTSYEFYVRSACGLNDSSNWAGPFSFTTLCGTITPDYTETFDTFVPSCWDEADAGSIATGPSSFGSGQWHNSTSLGSSVAINLYTTSRSDWILSPNFDLSAGGYEVSIDVAVTNWNSAAADAMGSDDSVRLAYTEDGITWNVLSTWTVADALSNSLNTIVVAVPSTGTTVQFGILATDGPVNDSEDYDFHIDNFIVRTPPSCSATSALAVTNVTSTAADLGWTENGTATTWDIEWDTAGFTASGTPTITGTTTNPHSLTGLTANTAYEFYVRADCGGSSSTWTGPFSFSTLCTAMTAPWMEVFATPSISSCWTTGGNTAWEYGNPTTTPSGFAAYGASTITDHTTGSAGTFIGMDGSDNSGTDVSYLETPMIDVSGLTTPFVSYWIFSNNTNDAALNKLIVDFYDGSNWVLLDSIQANLGASWVNYTTDLSSMTITGAVKLRFTVTASTVGNAFYNDILIDDIEIKEAPSCFDPSALIITNLSNTSADLGWTENGTAILWEVEYDTVGFTPGAGSMDTTSNNPFAVTGLMANTSYEFYVRAICGAGDTSGWVGPNSFFTGYCTPAPSSVDGSGITNVTMGGLSNTTGAEAGNYGDYSSMFAFSSQGDTMAIDITLQTGYTYDLWAWVDWNNDLDFDDAGEEFYLGESTSSNPTTYSATLPIPVGVALGNYRIRLGGADTGLGSTSPSNPCYSSSYGSFEDYTLVITTPLVLVSTVNSNVSCNGASDGNASVAVTGGATPYSYAWSNSDTTTIANSLAAGTYYVTVTDVNGQIGLDTVTITEPAALVLSLGNDTSICMNATMSLNAGTFTSYLWDDASTMATRSVVSTMAGVTAYWVEVSDGTCMTSDTINVTVYPAVVVSLGNDTTLCFEEVLTLDAGTFASYMWSDASTMQTLTVNGSKLGATTYGVIVTNVNGCIGADSVVVTGNPEVIVYLGADTNIWDPSVTSYTLDAGTGFSTYAWSDGTTTTQTYDVTPGADSNVSVIVTDVIGCTGTDTIVVDFVLGINTFEASTLKMYPNPAVDQITIELSNFKNVSEVNVTFITITGQTVLSKKIGVNGNSYVGTFDVSTLATGTYFVQFEANGEVVVRQFVIK